MVSLVNYMQLAAVPAGSGGVYVLYYIKRSP